MHAFSAPCSFVRFSLAEKAEEAALAGVTDDVVATWLLGSLLDGIPSPARHGHRTGGEGKGTPI